MLKTVTTSSGVGWSRVEESPNNMSGLNISQLLSSDGSFDSGNETLEVKKLIIIEFEATSFGPTFRLLKRALETVEKKERTEV